MTLAPGTRIGNYEISTALGAGGMGEVYRARDTRLDRTVAIKALPQAFARDPERLARFEREAKLLASLSHPNIAGIYGIEDVGGAPHLVLEFIDGTTLAASLASGPLPTRDALEVCAQIASGLEAAHERGIVHRDLKPGNVMITPSRAVKVLDFGLAKGGATEAGSSSDFTTSPTMAMTATSQGVILGTASYMSPEQARGKTVDRRTDVWAFGCVLFECLSGRRAFPGETVSDVIARILERDADWTLLPATVPPRLRDLLIRCLTKEADARPRDIGDLRRELNSIAVELSTPSGIRSAAAADVPSLAVLYFENLANDPESEYFCAGITEDILTDLSKIKGLRVASRNAVSRYRGAPADIAKVGADLGVRAVLEGSVRRAGGRVRISAQLINAADGFHLWAERYDRTLDDVFAVQEEIASSIAKALRGALTPAEARELQRDRPGDVRAYDLYLKGRELYAKYSTESLQAALKLFEQAVAIEPDYALAWAGIADCHGQMLSHSSPKDPAETRRVGLEAARRAIALDPKLAEAHKAEALVLRYSGDMAGSRAALVRALEVNPRFIPALINLGVDDFAVANLAAAERLVRKAIESDPQHAFAHSWLMFVMILTSRRDQALPLADRIEKLSGEQFYVTITHGVRASYSFDHDDLESVERILLGARTAGVEPHCILVLEAAIAVRRGRPDDARRLLGEVENSTELLPGYAAMLANVALRLGEPDRAARLFQRTGLQDFAAILLRLTPGLHPLLDLKPFAPRRSDLTLVWPLEAPMIDAARHALFREVRIESGRPEGSGAPAK